MVKKVDRYKEDGVDIVAGDNFSSFAKKLFETTYGISRWVEVSDLSRGNFRGPRGYVFKNLPRGCYSTAAADGIGTKVIIIDAAGNFQDASPNLLEMCAMDITRWGGLPLVFMNVLDVSALGEADSSTREAAVDLLRGLHRDAIRHKFVVLGGETAELGVCVGSDNPDATLKFNWAGFMIGVYHPQKMILGDTLKPGQVVIVLRDDFRSNGISSARKALAIKYGKEWWKNPDAMADILAAASPSAFYDRFLNDMHGWYNRDHDFRPDIPMHLIVHLSGGAFKSKFGDDILSRLGLSADLTNLYEPPEIMKKCAVWRGMPPEECYRTWNGGQGALVVVDKQYERLFVRNARNFGIQAQVAGEIKRKQKAYTVRIGNKFGGRKYIPY